MATNFVDILEQKIYVLPKIPLKIRTKLYQQFLIVIIIYVQNNLHFKICKIMATKFVDILEQKICVRADNA